MVFGGSGSHSWADRVVGRPQEIARDVARVDWVRAGVHLGAIVEAVVVRILFLRARPVHVDFIAIRKAILVHVGNEWIGRICAYFVTVSQPVPVAVVHLGKRAVDIKFIAIEESVTVEVGIERVRAVSKVEPVVKPIAVGVGIEGIGPLSGHFVAIAEAVAIGIVVSG
jgi:hypothetical protein